MYEDQSSNTTNLMSKMKGSLATLYEDQNPFAMSVDVWSTTLM